jgi:hypothetical protein
LSIVGGTSSNGNPNSPSTESQVAAVFYVVTFAALVLILLVSAPSRSLVPEDERIIVPAVALALPFIAARVLYSLLVVFVHSGTFVRIGGPIAVRLCMATAEEFVVVAIYLFLGYRLARLDKSEQGEILSRPWKDRSKGDRRRNRRHHHSRSRSGRSQDPEQGQNTGEEYYPSQEQGTGERYPPR